ncbi:MAG TPA: hypothetical protein VGO53_06110 [Steroidobacteraceae bacterium]|jgi:hypothetical protein|nr:hypothetical protein [Steroidobacteraceae bacterium]
MIRTPLKWTLAGALLALCAGTAAPALAQSAPAPSAVADGSATHATPDISGMWQVTRYERSIRTTDGKGPPLKPEARKVYEQNLAARKQLKPKSDMSRCVPPGTPRVMWAPKPLMILQTARKVTIIHEYQHLLRHIYLNESLPPAADVDTSYMGQSVGRWDGETLVVETIGLYDTTFLDRDGMPHSTGLRVTERLGLIDGKHLEDLVTFDDPETFTAPWTARLVFERKPGTELTEYHCLLKYEEY